MKRIIYIANARIPTEKAHGIQMMAVCEAFSTEGYEVIMLAPQRKNSLTGDAFAFYGKDRNFTITYISSPDFVAYGPIGFLLTTWVFSFLAIKKALFMDFDIVYSRDGRALWLLSWLNKKFIWELHDDERRWWARRVFKRSLGAVFTNKALALLHEPLFSKGFRSLVAPNGFDLNAFKKQNTQQELKQRLGLSLVRKQVVYAGHLYPYKGVHTLADVARNMSGIDFIFVGGTTEDLKHFRTENGLQKNIYILGHQPHDKVFSYLCAADLLILPNSGKEKFSSLYTSPIKLFEYMGSGTPIVASDLPSVREIVSEKEVIFFTPDDSESLKRSIQFAFTNPEILEQNSARAKELAKSFSWESRAKKIISYFRL